MESFENCYWAGVAYLQVSRTLSRVNEEDRLSRALVAH